MSEVKVNKISPRSGTNVTLGDSGDTFTIPSGATINNQGTATNFGATGSASWTTTVKTADFTAVAGEGYFVNTTSGSKTVTLPAGTAGAVVAFKDYADTFDTNALIIAANGSDKIGGSTDNKRLNTEGIAATLIFIDSTKGWLVTDDGLQSSLSALSYSINFLIIAGGGGGGYDRGGGGGAGGYRTSTGTSGGGGSAESAITTLSGVAYTVTVGAGAAGSVNNSSPASVGVASSIAAPGISTITSTGGGSGGTADNNHVGATGGSGGGSAGVGSPGSTGGPGTSTQGFNGGGGLAAVPNYGAGGGGGSGSIGITGNSTTGGNGGAGVASTITGSSVIRAGGGGGGVYGGGTGGSGGSGGGGTATYNSAGANATVNTGSGAGGGSGSPALAGGNGGTGVVILSMPDADYSGTTTGSPTVDTGVSGNTVLTFNASGSYTS